MRTNQFAWPLGLLLSSAVAQTHFNGQNGTVDKIRLDTPSHSAKDCSMPLPSSTQQLLVVATEEWSSSSGHLQRVEMNAEGKWVKKSAPIPVLLGMRGLARAKSEMPDLECPESEQKVEGDKRSPAGVFSLFGWKDSGVYSFHDQFDPSVEWSGEGSDSRVKAKEGVNFVKVGPRDYWVEDVASPRPYNQYGRYDTPPTLEEIQNKSQKFKDQMIQPGSYPHSIKLFIPYNAAGKGQSPVAGKGSAIFFHIIREKDGIVQRSAGCTTMNEEHLRQIIEWIDPGKNPLYVLLPRAELERCLISANPQLQGVGL